MLMTPVDLSLASVLRGAIAPGALGAAALFLAGALAAGVWPAAGPATKATAARANDSEARAARKDFFMAARYSLSGRRGRNALEEGAGGGAAGGILSYRAGASVPRGSALP